MKPPKKKTRWMAIDDIPGIAVKDEIIIVNSKRSGGILVCRWMPMSLYPDLMKYRLRLIPLDDVEDEPYPYPPTRVGSSGSPVSDPIKAGSDAAALFELIYSTGGGMPEEASA